MPSNATVDFLLPYYRNHGAMRVFWADKIQFSRTVSNVLDVDFNGATTMLAECARFFIDFTSVFLISSPSDVLDVLSEIKNAEKQTIFMKQFFGNRLVANELIFALLDDIETVKQIGNHDQWIEYPLRLRANSLIFSARPGELSWSDLFPERLKIEDFLQEYLLAWAFEEGKLSPDGIAYFSEKFPKKFEMLDSITRRRTGRSA